MKFDMWVVLGMIRAMTELGTSLYECLNEADPDLASIIFEIATTCGILSKDIAVAPLRNLTGKNGDINVQGEEQKHLDRHANDQLKEALSRVHSVCAIATEEEQDVHVYGESEVRGEYLVCLDPLDGSSNIDVNVNIGTIFGILKRPNDTDNVCSVEDFLQPGKNLVAAGYVLYGTCTMLVFTFGQSVQGFTFDPSSHDFYLTHPDMHTPDIGAYYSINEAYTPRFDETMQQYLADLKSANNVGDGPKSARYIGSLVADVHRNLLDGGIFMYPADTKNKKGKLRLLFEAFPIAFITEAARGSAVDGKHRILNKEPRDIHERTPFFSGSLLDVEELMLRNRD